MLILHFHDPHHRIHLHEPSRLVTLSDIPTDSSNKDLIYSHPCPIVSTLLFYNPYHHVSPSTLSRAPMSSPPRSIFSTWSLCYIIPRFVLFCPAYACPSTTHTVSITEHWRISTNVLACNSFGYVVSSNNNHPQVCLSTNPINQYPPVKSCVSLWFSPVTHHHPLYFLDLVITSKNNLLCVPPRHTLLYPV